MEPTAEPTVEPTAEPTAEPTVEPTVEPTAEPTTEPTAEPTEEPADDSSVIDESSVPPIPEESSVAPVPDDSSATDEPKDDKDTEQITGTVVGYDIDTVTIQVENDGSESQGDDTVEEEPKVEQPEGTEDEYPSITYDEAEGEESTYITFDITDASQDYADGINEGNEVTVSYTGDLDDMDSVQATNVSDTDAGTSASSSVFRGSVVSTTANTVTIKTNDDVSMTFSYDSLSDLNLAEGENVKVTADMNSAAQDQNVFKASKIERA